MTTHSTRFRSFVLTTLLAGAGLPGVAFGVCGDVNGDDDVLAGDALAVLRKAVGQPLALVCPVEQELKSCERDLDVWQPVDCPCFSGPGGLNTILLEHVTGVPTPLYAGECLVVDGLQTRFYGFQSSFPNPGVSGDGKCFVSIEAVASWADMPYRCSITQTIDESDTDCDSFPVLDPVYFELSQHDAIGCAMQIDVAPGPSGYCGS